MIESESLSTRIVLVKFTVKIGQGRYYYRFYFEN